MAKSAPTPEITNNEPPAPLPRGRKSGWKTKFVEDLKASPGKWGEVHGVSPSVVSHLKKIDPNIEAMSRNSRFVEGRKTRIADVHARYVAPTKKAPAKKTAAKK